MSPKARKLKPTKSEQQVMSAIKDLLVEAEQLRKIADSAAVTRGSKTYIQQMYLEAECTERVLQRLAMMLFGERRGKCGK